MRALFDQEADVRHDEVDAGQVVAGEGDAEVDREPVLAALRAEAVERQIHADLADAAERREDEFVLCERSSAQSVHRGSGAVKPVPSRTGNTSPAVMTSRRPSARRRTRRPASSSVSKTAAQLAVGEPRPRIGLPRPAARASQALRIAAKPAPAVPLRAAARPWSGDSASNSVGGVDRGPLRREVGRGILGRVRVVAAVDADADDGE